MIVGRFATLEEKLQGMFHHAKESFETMEYKCTVLFDSRSQAEHILLY